MVEATRQPSPICSKALPCLDEVLLTLLAERYDRRSVVITSNLVFSLWDWIFRDPMTTVAAIGCIVHHAMILELTGPSYPAEAAKARLPKDA